MYEYFPKIRHLLFLSNHYVEKKYEETDQNFTVQLYDANSELLILIKLQDFYKNNLFIKGVNPNDQI